MLELKKISKSYQTGTFQQQALNQVTLSFRKNEFVAILGPSGSGKTTLLNIIGGLDRYDSGDLLINGKSTKEYKEKDWDFYRNNCIGFIFQNYNLISHITVLENVELGMTLSGVSKKKKRKKAYEVLERVGLLEHVHKKPNQLSGGQMQRVAIARALANDPAIILADEPTGALDSKTSKQIMELIEEIAKDKLVIMVTHNQELASEYANRIVKMQDGNILEDSNPIQKEEKQSAFSIRKTAMKFMTALHLSFNNIKTKKGRTALTAFASSIGIIGIALILSLSNGFQIKIDEFERDTLSGAPIIISQSSIDMNETSMKEITGDLSLKEYPKEEKVYIQKDILEQMQHQNVFSEDYLSYLKKLDQDQVAGVAYQKMAHFIMINHNQDGSYQEVNTQNIMSNWVLLPSKVDEKSSYGVIENNYDILKGKIDEKNPGLILQVDSRNQVYESTLKALGISDKKSVDFDTLMNQELKIVFNDDYYREVGGYFIPNDDLESLYQNENSVTIHIQAIIRGKEDKKIITSGSGIAYTNALTDLVISKNKDSRIVKAQEEANYNILMGTSFEDDSKGITGNTKDAMLGYLGAEQMPVMISIYPKDFKSKEHITKHLDAYNKGKSNEERIEYTDMAAAISSLTTNIMDAITIVLIAFSSISLIVSSIMIGIITYISVLERTKEIGILRALGARKKDIKRVFNAETFLIGIFSGALGIGIAYLLTFPANAIIEELSGLPQVAQLNPIHALLLILISVILTVIGGSIPAHIASKKDPVESLRTE